MEADASSNPFENNQFNLRRTTILVGKKRSKGAPRELHPETRIKIEIMSDGNQTRLNYLEVQKATWVSRWSCRSVRLQSSTTRILNRISKSEYD